METWGVMIDWIGNDYAQTILDAAARFCRQREFSLVIFTSGPLSYTLEYEPLHDHLMSFIASPGVDRILICPPQMSRNGGDSLLGRIFQETSSKPLVCFGSSLPGLPSVVPRLPRVFYELLDHLYLHHGYRRLAWVSGPPDNPDSRERESLFRQYLERRGLQVDPDLMVRGDFNLASGREAGRYLGERRKDWDAIVAANDTMAMGIQEVLGPDVVVTGFDNDSAARRGGLTTIDPLLADQVTRALELLAIRESAAVGLGPPEEGEEGTLVLRSSCGCRPQSASEKGSWLATEKFTERIGVVSEQILRSRDLEELAECFNKALPLENIDYWKLVPPLIRGADSPSHLLSEPSLPSPFQLVIHSLFQGKELFGYFVHDGKNQDFVLSEWLRLNLCLLFPAWQAKDQSIQVQKVLGQELEKFARRRKDIETVVNSLPVWIVEVDRQGRVRYLNQTALLLLGCSPTEVRNTTLLPWVGALDRPRVEGRMALCMRSRTSLGIDFSFLGKDGRLIPVLGEVQPLSEEAGSNLATLFGSLHFGGGVRLAGLALRPVLEGIGEPEPELFKHFAFSRREKEVVLLLAKGMENSGMAAALGVSEATIRVLLHHLYMKTGVNRRQELLSLLAEYQGRASAPHSMIQALLSRLFGVS